MLYYPNFFQSLLAALAIASCAASSRNALGAIYSLESITAYRDSGFYVGSLDPTLTVANDVSYDTIVITTITHGPYKPPYAQPYFVYAGERGISATDEYTPDRVESRMTLALPSVATGGTWSGVGDFVLYVGFGNSYETPNGKYPVSLSDSPTYGPSVLLLNGQVVDTIEWEETFVITVVPEPSAYIGLLGFVGCLAYLRIR